MKKNGFCRAAMAGTALFLSIAVFPSQAAETGPGFEEAVEDTYDGPESPLGGRQACGQSHGSRTSENVRRPPEASRRRRARMADGSQEAPSSKVTETEPEGHTVPGRSYGTFKISAYCGCEACSGGHLYTYSGAVPKEDHTISADLGLQFPLGTKLLIDGIIYTVEDKGSGVVENHLDIYFDTHKKPWITGSRRWRYLRQSEPNRSIKKEGPCHPGFPSSFLSLFTDP